MEGSWESCHNQGLIIPSGPIPSESRSLYFPKSSPSLSVSAFWAVCKQISARCTQSIRIKIAHQEEGVGLLLKPAPDFAAYFFVGAVTGYLSWCRPFPLPQHWLPGCRPLPKFKACTRSQALSESNKNQYVLSRAFSAKLEQCYLDRTVVLGMAFVCHVWSIILVRHSPPFILAIWPYSSEDNWRDQMLDANAAGTGRDYQALSFCKTGTRTWKR